MRNNYIFDPVTTKMYPAKYAYEHEMMSEEEKAEFEEGQPYYGFNGVAGMLDLKARLQRTGRLDKHYFLGLPDIEARQAMLRLHLADRPLAQEMLEDRAVRMRRSIQAPEEDSKQQIQEVHITASNTRVRGFNAYLEEDRQVV